ncbi:MAG TPA: hypothetical protein VK558_09185 [Patescibacteria group bacterium]|nr:hypothetical protein [Patescibacteria group bacterium]
MSHTLTTEGRERVAEIAGRYGVSTDAALTLFSALLQSGGRMAQFNHPELGGGGQWMQGGMTMVGDMFNHGLKAKVDGLCMELSNLLPASPHYQAGNFQMQSQGGTQPNIFTAGSSADGEGWPDLGVPNWRGGQNDMRYAYYAQARRLVVSVGGRVTVYDTGDHQLQGVSQQQQNGGSSLAFTSQYGVVTLASLRPLSGGGEAAMPASSAAAAPVATAPMPNAEDLAGTKWVYGSASPLTLIADGSIGGDRQTAAFWAVEQGVLRLYAEDGRLAAKFDQARRDEAGGVVALVLAADPTQVLTQAATTGQPAMAGSGAGLLVFSLDLTQGAWDLEAAGTSLCRLRLLADGGIEGGRPVEARWRADGSSLTLLHVSGRPTARFASFQIREGRWTLSGTFIGEDTAECQLKQV